MIGRLLRWGNSFGIRISKRDVEKLRLKEGQEVKIDIEAPKAGRIDLSWLTKYEGMADLAEHHDEVDWA